MKKKFIYLIISLVVTTAWGCSKTLPRPSILEISICELPCWLDIQPNGTSKERVRDIISDHSFIIQDSIIELNREWLIFEEEIRFSLFEDWTSRNHIGTNIFFIKENVSMIIIAGDLGTNVQEVIDIVGQPAFVFASWVRPGNVEVNIVFPETGLLISSYVENEYSVITGELEISKLVIFAPNIYQDILELGLIHSGPYNPDVKNYFPWDGFGVIEEKYWPPRKDL